MSIKKNTPRQHLDPAVEAAMTSSSDPVMAGLSRLRKAKRLTDSQRKKMAADRSRTKATYDLPEDVKTLVEEIAHRLSIPTSQVATVLLVAGLDQMKMGKVDLQRDFEFKPSRSPRYDWVIKKLPQLDNTDVDAYVKDPGE